MNKPNALLMEQTGAWGYSNVKISSDAGAIVDDKNYRARSALYQAVFGIRLTKLEGTEFEMWAFPARHGGFSATGSLVRIRGNNHRDASVAPNPSFQRTS